MLIGIFPYMQFLYYLDIQWIVNNNPSKFQIFLLIHGTVLLFIEDWLVTRRRCQIIN